MRVHSHTKPTPLLRELLDEAGATWVDDDWDLCLPSQGRDQTAYLRALRPKPDAQVAAVPGNNILASKRSLWVILVKRFGRQAAESLAPPTWLLEHPKDVARRKAWHRPGRRYVLKLDGKAQRRGLMLVDSPDVDTSGHTLAQACLDDLMRVDGHRFHLRLYVLLTRRRGALRFGLHTAAKCVWARDGVFTDAAFRPAALPLTLSELAQDLDDPAALWQGLGRLVKHAAVAAEPYLGEPTLWDHPTFQLFGVDAVVDRSGRPWLLEFNRDPSMKPLDEADARLKRQVLRDMLAAVGVLPPGRMAWLPVTAFRVDRS